MKRDLLSLTILLALGLGLAALGIAAFGPAPKRAPGFAAGELERPDAIRLQARPGRARRGARNKAGAPGSRTDQGLEVPPVPPALDGSTGGPEGRSRDARRPAPMRLVARPGGGRDRRAPQRRLVHNSQAMTLRQLAARSERIVVGRVIDTKAAWNRDRTAITTTVRFAVRRNLKGAPAEVVELRVIGGEIKSEDVSLTVTHQPRFRPGEEGLVFIDEDPKLWTSVTGANQGFLKFRADQPGRRLVHDGFGRPVFGVGEDSELLTAPIASPNQATEDDIVAADKDVL